MEGCCPAGVALSGGDEALCARINDRVFERIAVARPRRRSKLPGAFLLAAVLILLLGTAAFAISEFYMDAQGRDSADAPLTGRWLMRGEDGEILTDIKTVFPEAGMVFSFSGPEESRNRPEFRCFWLPAAATDGITDGDGWTTYLADEYGDEPWQLPYCIEAGAVEPGVTRLVLNGRVQLVKEEQWGDWQVTELSSDYSAINYWAYDRANYILLFHAEQGWLVQVKGTEELETLEHIARQLEIRESGSPFEPTGYEEMLGSLDLGRG